MMGFHHLVGRRSLRNRAGDPATAEDARTVVEDRGLARRHSTLREGELDLHLAARSAARLNARRNAGMPGADADRRLDLVRRRLADPVKTLAREAAGGEGLLVADDYLVLLGKYAQHVEAVRGGDAEAAALADGVAVVGRAFAETRSVLGDDGCRACRRAGTDYGGEAFGAPRRLGGDEVLHLTVDEADLHALALVGNDQAGVARDLAHFGLRALAEREARAGELCLRELEEEVALVLRLVDAAVELWPCRPFDDARVVAGGHRVGADRASAREQRIELDEGVATHAGAGRGPRAVVLDEGDDDVAAEGALHAQGVVRDAGLLRHAAGVAEVERAAAAAASPRPRRVVPQEHREADDALLAREQPRRHRGIQATAHGDGGEAVCSAGPRDARRIPA